MISLSTVQMASDANFLLCHVCLKARCSLPRHLRKKCMQHSTEEEIEVAVDKAKKDVSEFLRKGRFWKYSEIVSIFQSPDPCSRMIKELQKRGNVVMDLPSQLDDVGAEDTAQSPSQPLATEPEQSRQHKRKRMRPETHVWVLMEKRGLNKKHSLCHPLLSDFISHLDTNFYDECYKQEVEQVARFLYFMDPTAPSLEFVRQYERIQEYVRKLTEIKVSRNTVRNYLFSIKRFLKYHMEDTDLSFRDKDLYDDSVACIQFLTCLKLSYTMKVCTDVPRNSSHRFLAVIYVAKNDFLGVIGKLIGPDRISAEFLTKHEQVLVLYYLEAILILKQVQRPAVVRNMTVSEWVCRTQHENGYVTVKVDSVPLMHMTVVILTLEEEMWFDTYYTEVRPVMLGRRKGRWGKDYGERFFISATGKSVYSPSNDMHRFHQLYNLPTVTSMMVRRAFGQSSVDMDYIKLSNSEKHSRMKECYNTPAAVKRQTETSQSGIGTEMGKQSAYDLLLRTPPRNCGDGICRRAAFWNVAMVGRSVFGGFTFLRRQPSVARIVSWIKKQGWRKNRPDASRVLASWMPPGGVASSLDSPVIRKMVRRQKWKGLLVSEIEGKGRCVVTTRPFVNGEVVCDYHGRLVSRQEGLRIRASMSAGESGYMFFYTDSHGQAACIDAHNELCECHPDQVTFGRLIRHAAEKNNLRPRRFVAEGKDVILFLAARDIQINEELLYNYGVNRRCFAGEGLDLDWL
ncbi:hypothetical protein AMELA_G00143470 [Ameiurus melas]|uniref:SET domain-containing protein n=1 Tax=Ameiurus melas TaxID=219545 RepID=A0A7J6ANL7_AMEME|nr:hypothetical protein AMELA_G00143470 [Ameiurus melas]